jgi:hypothetical protein
MCTLPRLALNRLPAIAEPSIAKELQQNHGRVEPGYPRKRYLALYRSTATVESSCMIELSIANSPIRRCEQQVN